jgi:hypothetical protein
MTFRQASIVLAAVLALGLAACDNDDGRLEDRDLGATDTTGTADDGDILEPQTPQCEPPGDSGPRGCIASPQTGDSVSQTFTVVGNLMDIPRGSHVWLATAVDNLYWPKEPEVVNGRDFSSTVVESGSPPDGELELVLLLVDRGSHEDIKDWLDQAEATGDYYGLSIGSMEVLDRVSELNLS